MSCSTTSTIIKEQKIENYKIIEKVNYGKKGLFYKTLSYEELPFNYSFSYDKLNQNNVRYNSITERNRFVNFDTVFNIAQQRKIDSSFKNLSPVKLKKSLFTDPKIISKKRSEYGTPRTELVGYSSISYPFIVNSKNGEKYGFIYRDDGLMYIYKKENKFWEEFARLEIHFVN